MKPVVLHCEADVELTAAAKRYACARTDLARDFLHAFRVVKDAIAAQPARFLVFGKAGSPGADCRISVSDCL